MKKKRIKQRNVAEAISVSNSAVSQWFNDRASLSSDKVQKLVEYIEASV